MLSIQKFCLIFTFPLLTICFLFLFIQSCSRAPSTPNVLLITLDTVRADALGCYGNTQVRTPHLDRIAAEGALFEDTICQIPATLTSHTAMMTGRYPKSTGVRFRNALVTESEETLAEVFEQKGYATAAFISAYVLEPAFGLNQGFESYELGSMQHQGKMAKPERRADETVGQTIEYLKNRPNKPFFVWIHLYDAHTPYEAPPPFGKLYDPDYTGSITGSVAQITRLNASKGREANERDLEHLKALYWGEVSYLDDQIGRLLKFMSEENLMNNTVIATMADHGESLGEKGHFFHGDTLYNPDVHVPFLLRYPAKIKAGTRINSLAQSIDLLPTLLALTDAGEPRNFVEGKNLAPLLNNSPEEFQEAPGFLETEADPVAEGNKIFGLRTGEYKLIDRTLYRRTETPLGVMTEIPLKGPAIVMVRIKGGESVRLMAHIRYRTQGLYTSRDTQLLSQLNSTVVYAEAFGSDPLHRAAEQQKSFLPVPPGWRIQATPDLYRIAKDYGDAQGWPTQWMVIEGVGVDASLPYQEESTEFTVDQFELYAPTLRFPNSPRFRNPFWVVEDFEGNPPRGLVDSQQGSPHTMQTSWVEENLINGKRQQKIRITFPTIESSTVNEVYNIVTDATEAFNLLQSADVESASKALEISNNSHVLIEQWRKEKPGEPSVMEMDAAQREALESLGYTK